MSAGLEPDVAEEFIYGLLNGDATLTGLLAGGIKPGGSAPQGTPYPFVTYQMMSSIDLMVVDAIRIWTNLVYLVKVVGESADYQTLRAVVARIDALLHRASGTATDGTIWACVREQSIRMPEVVSGKQFRHDGGLYRLYAT